MLKPTITLNRGQKGRRVTRNLSLHRDHDLALRLIVLEDGHETPSVGGQELIEREAVRRWGLDWRQHVRSAFTVIEPEQTELAAVS